ncbi:MAG: hypothetical protein ACFFCW_08490 [Candidatus Hodarchaeota archaeon]
MQTKKKILYIIPVVTEQQRVQRVLDQLKTLKEVDTEAEVQHR